jgi:hypothetical protein
MSNDRFTNESECTSNVNYPLKPPLDHYYFKK